MAKKVKMPGRIESASPDGIVTGAAEIFDDGKEKMQSVINTEVSAELLRLENEKQNNLNFDNAPTENSNNPITSGAVYTAEKALSDAIEAILILIPSAATALNQLADKSFVESALSTATATFRGSYNVVSDLGLAYNATHEQIAAKLGQIISTADNNDYCFVQVPESATSTDINHTERYKFNGSVWAYEYDLNNSGFTADQWAAINSNITAVLVAKLTQLPTADVLATLLAGKQDNLTFDNRPTAGSDNPVKSGGVYASENEIIALINALEVAKQDKLTFDSTPTNGSSNPVTSGGVYEAIYLVQVALASLDNRVLSAEHSISVLTENVGILRSLYQALTLKDIIVGSLPTTGVANTVYRVPGVSTYADWMYYDGAWVKLAEYTTLDGYLYKGIATPSGSPAASAVKMFYFALTAGTYTNFGGLVCTEGINILKYDGANWTKEQITYTDGGVYDITANTGQSYADLSSSLGTNGANVPVEVRKGGMSIKFVRTSDNKYVQYRLMSDTFNTTVANWQGVTNEVKAESKDLVESGVLYNNFDKLDFKIDGRAFSNSAQAVSGTNKNIDLDINYPVGTVLKLSVTGLQGLTGYLVKLPSGTLISNYLSATYTVESGITRLRAFVYGSSIPSGGGTITFTANSVSINSKIEKNENDISDIKTNIIPGLSEDIYELQTKVNGQTISKSQALTSGTNANINLDIDFETGTRLKLSATGVQGISGFWSKSPSNTIIVGALNGSYTVEEGVAKIRAFISGTSIPAGGGTVTVKVENVSIEESITNLKAEQVVQNANIQSNTNNIGNLNEQINGKSFSTTETVTAGQNKNITLTVDFKKGDVLYLTCSASVAYYFIKLPSGTIITSPYTVTEETLSSVRVYVYGTSLSQDEDVTFAAYCKGYLYEKVDGYEADIHSLDLPSYYFTNNYVGNKISAINSYCDSCSTNGDAFIFITDIHNGLNANKYPNLLNYISKNTNIYRLFSGGDTAQTSNIENSITKVVNQIKKAFTKKIFFAVGNHEYDGGTSPNVINYCYNMDNEGYGVVPSLLCYYVDNPYMKVRYVILNSERYTQESQSTWFTNEALNVGSDWKVFIFTHWITDFVDWAQEGGYPRIVENSTTLKPYFDAIKDFNADSNKGKVIAIFQGHWHADYNLTMSDGTPVILCSADAYNAERGDVTAPNRVAGTISEQSFDVVVSDFANKTLHLVRIGGKAMQGGQEVEERTITYT